MRAFKAKVKSQAEASAGGSTWPPVEASYLANIVLNSDDAIIGKDLSGTIRSWNKGAERIFGYPAAEVVGSSGAMLAPPGAADDEPDLVARIKRGERAGQYETTRARKDSRLIKLSVSLSPIRDASGQLVGISQICREVAETGSEDAERRRLREELRQVKQEWERTFDSVPDLIAILDRNHKVIRVNRAMVERLGAASAGQCVGLNCYQCVHGLDHAPDFCPHTLTIQDGQEHTAEIYEKHLGGYFQVSTTPIKNETGEVIGTVHVARDISQRKRMEEMLRESNQTLEQTIHERTAALRETVAELESFSYSVSHDLRAPLRSIKLFSTLLLEEYQSASTDQKDYASRIAKSAHRMERLIHDILAYSRVCRNELPLHPVDAGKLLHDMMETYPDLQAPKAEILIQGEFPLVLANEAALTQCFSNLLGNAVKFVETGTPPRVTIWAERIDGFARFFFQDNGIGMPREHQDKIFRVFERLNPQYEGTGIGLAIVKRAVERMDGRIGVESEPGKGSRFWLDFKVAS